MTDQQFSPTPLHGAAYAVAIETVGGSFAIGDCATAEQLQAMNAKLDALLEWSATQKPHVRKAYAWGVDRTKRDIEARYRVHQHSQAVRAAFQALPRPPVANPEEPRG